MVTVLVTMVIGYRVSNHGYRVSNHSYRVSNYGYRVSNHGYRVSNHGYHGYRVSNHGYRVSGKIPVLLFETFLFLMCLLSCAGGYITACTIAVVVSLGEWNTSHCVSVVT